MLIKNLMTIFFTHRDLYERVNLYSTLGHDRLIIHIYRAIGYFIDTTLNFLL